MADIRQLSSAVSEPAAEPDPFSLRKSETAPETSAPRRSGYQPRPAGNTATGTLKLIALGFMLIDHLGAVVFPQIGEMRILGRIAFPLYCWCMIVGLYYTRSVPKYLGRILLAGLISQPLYAWIMNHMGTSGILLRDLFLGKPNILLTLFLGLTALWGIREKKYFSQIWAPAAALALATILNADYGWRGILFMILLYLVQDSRPAMAAMMTAYFLFWGASYGVTSSLFGITLNLGALPGWLSLPLKSFLRLETYALFSLIFILIPYRKNIRLPLWLSYAIYPAHLLIVLLFKTLCK